MDDTDPLVTVMKVEKAPQETYADIGGLDNQIQEIKVGVQPARFLALFSVLPREPGILHVCLLVCPTTDLADSPRSGAVLSVGGPGGRLQGAVQSC